MPGSTRRLRGTGDFGELVLGMQRGDERSWSAVYDSLAPGLRGYLRASGSADPDDLLGEVFLQIARNVGRFEGDESSFRSWAFMVAYNRVVDERRRLRRRPATPTEPETMVDIIARDDVEAEAVRSIAVAELRTILAALTADQRDVLELRVIAGLSLEEVALVVGKPVTAVKALQRRAIASLRRQPATESAIFSLLGVSP